MVYTMVMEKPTLRELREKEADILSRRENRKDDIKVLTKELYNVRQKIKYAQRQEHKKPCGRLFKMFGKKRSELTAEELKIYNNTMQKIRQESLKKGFKTVDTTWYFL